MAIGRRELDPVERIALCWPIRRGARAEIPIQRPNRRFKNSSPRLVGGRRAGNGQGRAKGAFLVIRLTAPFKHAFPFIACALLAWPAFAGEIVDVITEDVGRFTGMLESPAYARRIEG